MKLLTLAPVVLFGALFCSTAQADTILFGSGPGLEGYASFDGSLDWNGSSLTVQLRNTTNAALGGYLTAFALDGPSGLSVRRYSTDNSNFGLIVDPATRPWTGYDFGASATRGQWQGGGNPRGGLGVGESASWKFAFTGDTSGLTAGSFLGQPLAARFRGGEGGWSDKVPSSGNPVPEPGTCVLLGLAILGVAGRRRRRT